MIRFTNPPINTRLAEAANARTTVEFVRINPGTTTCIDGDGKPNGLCRCELEPEVNVFTGTTGRLKAKMIKDLQYEFVVVRD